MTKKSALTPQNFETRSGRVVLKISKIRHSYRVHDAFQRLKISWKCALHPPFLRWRLIKSGIYIMGWFKHCKSWDIGNTEKHRLLPRDPLFSLFNLTSIIYELVVEPPIWKISVKSDHFPKDPVKTKTVWNHHLVQIFYHIDTLCDDHPLFSTQRPAKLNESNPLTCWKNTSPAVFLYRRV